MAAIISSTFRAQNSQAFIEDIKGDRSNVYVGLGKSSPWAAAVNTTTDTTAPTPEDTLDAINEARQQLIGLKLVTDADVSHVVPRYDWVAGATFVAWDSTDPAIYDKAFYALTPDFKVYKCIVAGGGTVSDVPTHTDENITATGDGYYWKYMYTIIASDSEKFLTNSYMPVKTLTESTKADVSATVSSSTTFELKFENPFIQVGQKMVNNTSGSRTVASSVVTAISGKKITVSVAVSYSGNDSITFGDFLSTNPLYSQQQSQKASRAVATAQGIERIKITNGGSSYSTHANLVITLTGDGSGFSINGGTNGGTGVKSTFISSNEVQDIILTGSAASDGTDSAGTNFTVADVVITGGSGSGATGAAIIAPRGRPGFSAAAQQGGHGCDPVFELGGFYVALNVQISGTDDAEIANTQDFRQITLIKNPLTSVSDQSIPTAPASALNALKFFTTDTSSPYSALSSLGTKVQTADYVMIQGSTFKAYVVNVDVSNKKIYYFQNDLTGYGAPSASSDTTFATGGITDANLNLAAAHLNAVSGTAEFDAGSGEVLFLENRDPIQRSTSQIEDIKLIIEF